MTKSLALGLAAAILAGPALAQTPPAKPATQASSSSQAAAPNPAAAPTPQPGGQTIQGQPYNPLAPQSNMSRNHD